MKCKFCGSEETVCNGQMNGHQRYRCKGCGKNFTNTPFRGVGPEKKRLAISLYASGLSLRRTGQFFGVSTVAVMKWVRQFADTECSKPVPASCSVIVMEVDEFWHFLKKRNNGSGSSRPTIAITNDSSTGNVGIVLLKPSSASMIA